MYGTYPDHLPNGVFDVLAPGDTHDHVDVRAVGDERFGPLELSLFFEDDAREHHLLAFVLAPAFLLRHALDREDYILSSGKGPVAHEIRVEHAFPVSFFFCHVTPRF